MIVTPEDILAGIVVVGCLILLGIGKDDIVKSVLLTVVAYYFGKKTREERKPKGVPRES